LPVLKLPGQRPRRSALTTPLIRTHICGDDAWRGGAGLTCAASSCVAGRHPSGKAPGSADRR